MLGQGSHLLVQFGKGFWHGMARAVVFKLVESSNQTCHR